MFPERDTAIRVLSCFTLPLPAQAVDRIIDTQLCRGILFVLSSLGWICILSGKDVDVRGRSIPRKMSLFKAFKFRVWAIGGMINFSVKLSEKKLFMSFRYSTALLYIPVRYFSVYKYIFFHSHNHPVYVFKLGIFCITHLFKMLFIKHPFCACSRRDLDDCLWCNTHIFVYEYNVYLLLPLMLLLY